MKRYLFLSCLALCGCMATTGTSAQNYQQPAPMAAPCCAESQLMVDYGYAPQGYQQAPQMQQQAPQMQANPYALKPPAYEDSSIAMQRKEQEIFQKEKALLNAQQELYEREKTLANREADFYNRSKALSYKEQLMQEKAYQGRSSYMDEPMGYATNAYRPKPAAPQPVPMGQANPSYYSEPAEYTTEVNAMIIMQHPIQRDLVRCPATDDVCLLTYERLGYVRSNNLSRFTAEEEVISENAYPAGKWRDGNTIPRW